MTNRQITGWSVLLVAITLATGIALIMLNEREAGLVIIGSSGWGGYALKLAEGKNESR